MTQPIHDLTVTAARELVEQTLRRHEAELDDLGERIREELVVPACEAHGLTFSSRNETFCFQRPSGADGPGLFTYGDRADLDAPTSESSTLSAAAKESLGSLLDLLNHELVHDGQRLGSLVPSVDLDPKSTPSSRKWRAELSVAACLRRVADSLSWLARRPDSAAASRSLGGELVEAYHRLRLLKDVLPPGARRAAASGQIAALQRVPIQASPAEILSWATDWEAT
jgi:hypothetical protein